MDYFDNACIGTNFFKILQGSSNFFKTQHVLYFLNAGGSRLSNWTFPYVMKIMRISLHICISLHFSSFLCISLHFSAFLWICLHLSEFLWFLYISLHFTCYLLTERTVVPWTPFFLFPQGNRFWAPIGRPAFPTVLWLVPLVHVTWEEVDGTKLSGEVGWKIFTPEKYSPLKNIHPWKYSPLVPLVHVTWVEVDGTKLSGEVGSGNHCPLFQYLVKRLTGWYFTHQQKISIFAWIGENAFRKVLQDNNAISLDISNVFDSRPRKYATRKHFAANPQL